MIDIDVMRKAYSHSSSISLRRRRAIVALCALGLVDFAIISLYQVGVMRHLPDLPSRYFDSDRVNRSHKAFALGGPDGPFGALQYASQMVLASYGGTRASGRPRWLNWALAATGVAGAAAGLDYLRDMLFRQKRACPYCIVGACLNFGVAYLSCAEARSSVRQLGHP